VRDQVTKLKKAFEGVLARDVDDTQELLLDLEASELDNLT
jgi:hypothetical protein